MQTLTFNTTTKEVRLLDELKMIIVSYNRVSTVKCSELGYYEIMRKEDEDSYSAFPVMRLPIANTNMIIEK
jgi:hypothetical protein